MGFEFATVPNESVVDCFCNNTDWSPLVSQKSTSLIAGGGGGGCIVSPPLTFLEHPPCTFIIPTMAIINNFICIETNLEIKKITYAGQKAMAIILVLQKQHPSYYDWHPDIM